MTSDAQLAKGAYLARIGDCAACHTANKAQPFAGGLPLATPFGTLYSTNITADASTGIGGYSYDDFATALRQGVAKDGRRLYPAMPYPSYAKIDDADMHALYRYFMQGVKPVTRTNRESELRFPFNIRALMTVWDRWYAHDHPPYQSDPRQSVEWNRGAYLVQGLAHCGACHTPHGMLGQEDALDDKDNTAFLSGNALAGWYAPNLRGHPAQASDGNNVWSKADLVAYLRSGRMHDGAAFGPMTEVIDDSTQYLHDDDLNAIATYLTSPALRARATPLATQQVRRYGGDGDRAQGRPHRFERRASLSGQLRGLSPHRRHRRDAGLPQPEWQCLGAERRSDLADSYRAERLAYAVHRSSADAARDARFRLALERSADRRSIELRSKQLGKSCGCRYRRRSRESACGSD